MVSIANVTQQLNLLINQAIGGGVAIPDIETVLADASAALNAQTTLSHDRTIVDPGPELNPANFG